MEFLSFRSSIETKSHENVADLRLLYEPRVHGCRSRLS